MNSAMIKMYRRKAIIQSFLLIIAVVFIAIGIIAVGTSNNVEETNRINCAVTGYEEDCKTPLKVGKN